MRVIAGTAKSMPLKTIEGIGTRPTTDRIKETLFNVLQSEIVGCKFLDLFSGSGAIGIEAISRGARSAVFVEQSKVAVACINDNLKFTKLADKATVMECDVLTALHRLKDDEPFDIIFMDAPYQNGLERPVLEFLKTSSLIDEYTTIVIEEKLDTDLSYIDHMGYQVYKTKNYKTNKHLFLNRKENN